MFNQRKEKLLQEIEYLKKKRIETKQEIVRLRNNQSKRILDLIKDKKLQITIEDYRCNSCFYDIVEIEERKSVIANNCIQRDCMKLHIKGGYIITIEDDDQLWEC